VVKVGIDETELEANHQDLIGLSFRALYKWDIMEWMDGFAVRGLGWFRSTGRGYPAGVTGLVWDGIWGASTLGRGSIGFLHCMCVKYAAVLRGVGVMWPWE
jgi:hypothetical protein